QASAKLSLFPEKVTLYGAAARQKVVVTWIAPDGIAHDVTAECRLTITRPDVARVDHQTVVGISKGDAQLLASYRDETAAGSIEVANATGAKELSFVKDIVPIFTKFGCAGSNCHGSIRGKAGFKLSLF